MVASVMFLIVAGSLGGGGGGYISGPPARQVCHFATGGLSSFTCMRARWVYDRRLGKGCQYAAAGPPVMLTEGTGSLTL